MWLANSGELGHHCRVHLRSPYAFLIIAILLAPALASPPGAQKQKLPKVRELDSGITWYRDPVTGELVTIANERVERKADRAVLPRTNAIRSTTQMVAVTCMVATREGAPVAGLTSADFRIFEDDVQQKIAYFDASTEPASVAIVIDASPSVLPDSEQMKSAADSLIDALAPLDQAAVVDFAAHTYLQLSFSDVRELMRRAVVRVNVRDLFSDTGGSNIYEAVYLTAHELFPGRTGRKAIVLLTDGQDSGLGLTLDPASMMPSPMRPNRLTFEDLARLLATQNIQVFAVSTENRPKIMTPTWLAEHAGQTLVRPAARENHIPPYTLYLAELVRRAGGQLYFLHEAPTLADTFRQIAQKIRAEYTLGYYPRPDGRIPTVAGWHRLGVEVAGEPNIIISHRAAYYVSLPE
jgi:Ca-activated chloride channel homolog